MENLVVLGANDEYVQQSKEYGKKDILLALALYVILTIELLLLGNLFIGKNTNLTEAFIFIATGISSLSITGFVFLFCSIRKQGLVTLGFSKSEARQSFLLGMALLILVAVIGFIRVIVSGSKMQTDFSEILMKIVYYLIFIGFKEELVFRGYIGTRFYGFFSDKRISIMIVGIMFSLMHVPFQMMMAQMSLFDYISLHWVNLIKITIFHCGFQWLYSRYNSIIAPTILHFMINFIQWFIIQ